ncbi:hypothetical protein AMS68_000727 [Peltaster fructicola]|uniref:Major facilitator superfamily (MFS) profile domain-containing protein n=1 Tax=Peltaster fructicola TaxID=286661 RepID=A0A6H0XL34_9PEZI|nr:hypothetical protein AMS68_000727 [Peltaster fructicola]
MDDKKTDITQLEELRTKERDGSFTPPTAAEEAAVIRKLDWRLLPMVFVLYTLAILDRSNLGNAKLAQMTDDIDLSGNRYNWLGTIFYIAYICSQWTAMGWKQFKPHRWAAFCVLFWGFVASIQAATTTWGGLMTCRFFLGVAEAMFGPGVPLYLSFFYPRDKVGFRQGVFISGAAMANVYGGALAYGISQIRGALAPWRVLFLIEGLPTMVFAVFAWYLLPDSIREAKFLTQRDRDVAIHMAGKNQRLDVEHEQGLRLREVWEGIRDPKSWIPALCYFGCNVSYASLPLFVPTIILQIGTFNQIQSQGLSAPPYVVAFITIISFCWLSDRYKVRGPFCFAAAMIGAIGFIINGTTTATAPRYFSLFLSVNIFASVAILLAWVSNLNASESKRASAYTVLSTIGQCGPLLGTNIFQTQDQPYFRKGMWISAAFCLLVAFLSVALSFWLIHENKKMDAQGVPEVAELEETSDAQPNGRPAKYRHIW